MVAKRRRPPKIQQSDFVVKPVLSINMATDENQASMGHITTLDISPVILLGRSKRVRDGLGVSKWIISLGHCGFATIF